MDILFDHLNYTIELLQDKENTLKSIIFDLEKKLKTIEIYNDLDVYNVYDYRKNLSNLYATYMNIFIYFKNILYKILKYTKKAKDGEITASLYNNINKCIVIQKKLLALTIEEDISLLLANFEARLSIQPQVFNLIAKKDSKIAFKNITDDTTTVTIIEDMFKGLKEKGLFKGNVDITAIKKENDNFISEIDKKYTEHINTLNDNFTENYKRVDEVFTKKLETNFKSNYAELNRKFNTDYNKLDTKFNDHYNKITEKTKENYKDIKDNYTRINTEFDSYKDEIYNYTTKLTKQFEDTNKIQEQLNKTYDKVHKNFDETTRIREETDKKQEELNSKFDKTIKSQHMLNETMKKLQASTIEKNDKLHDDITEILGRYTQNDKAIYAGFKIIDDSFKTMKDLYETNMSTITNEFITVQELKEYDVEMQKQVENKFINLVINEESINKIVGSIRNEISSKIEFLTLIDNIFAEKHTAIFKELDERLETNQSKLDTIYSYIKDIEDIQLNEEMELDNILDENIADIQPAVLETINTTLNTFLQNVDLKMDTHNQNTDKRINTYNQNMDEKMDTHNQNIDERINAHNQNMNERMNAHNKNIDERMNAHNDAHNKNIDERINAHNQHMDERMNAYNQNMDERMNVYNQNIDEKMNTHNQQIDARMNAHNQNIDGRMNAHNQHMDAMMNANIISDNKKLTEYKTHINEKLSEHIATLSTKLETHLNTVDTKTNTHNNNINLKIEAFKTALETNNAKIITEINKILTANNNIINGKIDLITRIIDEKITTLNNGLASIINEKKFTDEIKKLLNAKLEESKEIILSREVDHNKLLTSLNNALLNQKEVNDRILILNNQKTLTDSLASSLASQTAINNELIKRDKTEVINAREIKELIQENKKLNHTISNKQTNQDKDLIAKQQNIIRELNNVMETHSQLKDELNMQNKKQKQELASTTEVIGKQNALISNTSAVLAQQQQLNEKIKNINITTDKIQVINAKIGILDKQQKMNDELKNTLHTQEQINQYIESIDAKIGDQKKLEEQTNLLETQERINKDVEQSLKNQNALNKSIERVNSTQEILNTKINNTFTNIDDKIGSALTNITTRETNMATSLKTTIDYDTKYKKDTAETIAKQYKQVKEIIDNLNLALKSEQEISNKIKNLDKHQELFNKLDKLEVASRDQKLINERINLLKDQKDINDKILNLTASSANQELINERVDKLQQQLAVNAQLINLNTSLTNQEKVNNQITILQEQKHINNKIEALQSALGDHKTISTKLETLDVILPLQRKINIDLTGYFANQKKVIENQLILDKKGQIKLDKEYEIVKAFNEGNKLLELQTALNTNTEVIQDYRKQSKQDTKETITKVNAYVEQVVAELNKGLEMNKEANINIKSKYNQLLDDQRRRYNDLLDEQMSLTQEKRKVLANTALEILQDEQREVEAAESAPGAKKQQIDDRQKQIQHEKQTQKYEERKRGPARQEEQKKKEDERRLEKQDERRKQEIKDKDRKRRELRDQEKYERRAQLKKEELKRRRSYDSEDEEDKKPKVEE